MNAHTNIKGVQSRPAPQPRPASQLKAVAAAPAASETYTRPWPLDIMCRTKLEP